MSTALGKLPGMGQGVGPGLSRLSGGFWQGSACGDDLQASSKSLDTSEAVAALREREHWMQPGGTHGAGWGAAGTAPRPSQGTNPAPLPAALC